MIKKISLCFFMIICVFPLMSFADKAQELYQEGLKYYLKRDFKNASSEWQKALLLQPDNEKIKEYLDKSQAKYNDSLMLFYNGREALSKNDYDNAEKDFKDSLIINPLDDRVKNFLRLCYIPEIKIETPVPWFTVSHKVNPFKITLNKGMTVDQWITNWDVDIMDPNGEMIRKISGKGDPPASVNWDMKDSSGAVRKIDKAKYAVVLTSLYGRKVSSPTNQVGVDNEPPTIYMSCPTNFSPDDVTGKKNNTLTFKVSVQDKLSGVANWHIEISSEDKSQLKQTIPGTENTITWKGDYQDNTRIAGGSTVNARVVAFDNASNMAASDWQKITTEIYLVQEKRGIVMNLPNLEFDTGKDSLKKLSFSILNRVGEILKNYKTLNFIIEGHTDNVGDKDSNMDLSRRRAQSVFNYLHDKYSISKDQVEIKGYGDSHPIQSNDTDEGRARNRRVEIVIKTLEQ